MRDAAPDLDDGWRYLDEGNIASAHTVASRLLGDDPSDPEGLLLLAACHRSEGKPEEAIGVLQRATGAAKDWAAPEQWMAEILAHDLGRPADALAHVSAALDLADEEEEFLDAITLKSGLEIQLGKIKAARATLSELPAAEEMAASPDVGLDLAYLFLEAEMVDEAEQRFRAIADASPTEGEAWYGLGLCAEERHDEAEKRKAWLRVLELDTAAPLLNPHLGEAEMAEVAERALEELPERVRNLIVNVPILIADLPARAEVETGLDPRLLGLFEGSAYADASSVGGTPQVTRILLFRKNLERMAMDPDDLREQIRITLLHETGHFFGMSEEDLQNVGLD